jgi:hypothetical protein
VIGIVRNLQCSPEGNRLQVAVGEKLMAFDLPESEAIEMPANPAGKLALTCGPLKPTPIAIDFAPPRTVIDTSAGIVRSLEF